MNPLDISGRVSAAQRAKALAAVATARAREEAAASEALLDQRAREAVEAQAYARDVVRALVNRYQPPPALERSPVGGDNVMPDLTGRSAFAVVGVGVRHPRHGAPRAEAWGWLRTGDLLASASSALYSSSRGSNDPDRLAEMYREAQVAALDFLSLHSGPVWLQEHDIPMADWLDPRALLDAEADLCRREDGSWYLSGWRIVLAGNADRWPIDIVYWYDVRDDLPTAPEADRLTLSAWAVEQTARVIDWYLDRLTVKTAVPA